MCCKTLCRIAIAQRCGKSHGNERVYVAKPSSLGTILVILITGLLSAVFLVMLLGALLIWLPALILFFTAVIVVGLLRMYFRGEL